MFNDTFLAELTSRAGSNVEIATDSNLIEGILASVTANLVLVIEGAQGYGDNGRVYVPLQAINFVRFT